MSEPADDAGDGEEDREEVLREPGRARIQRGRSRGESGGTDPMAR